MTKITNVKFQWHVVLSFYPVSSIWGNMAESLLALAGCQVLFVWVQLSGGPLLPGCGCAEGRGQPSLVLLRSGWEGVGQAGIVLPPRRQTL